MNAHVIITFVLLFIGIIAFMAMVSASSILVFFLAGGVLALCGVGLNRYGRIHESDVA